MYTGELIALIVAISWTATAMFAEIASKRIGSLPLNVIRMCLSLLFLAATLWLTTGKPYPLIADAKTWMWLFASGFVGYVLGDFCLFQSYIVMGSRFGQLFMTLASPAAALTAMVTLGERMSPTAVIGMFVTIIGIGMSILSKGRNGEKLELKLPLKGVLLGIGAGLGQGVGLVLSKIGMQHYKASILAAGITDMDTYVFPDALIKLPLGFTMPFASTMMRAVIGLIGFTIALALFTKGGIKNLGTAVRDRKAMPAAIAATIFGPFLGVSLSLMATLYTSAGIAQTIMATTPVLIILPSWLIFKQKVRFPEILGAIISVCGVAMFFI